MKYCNRCPLFTLCLGEHPDSVAKNVARCIQCGGIFWRPSGRRLNLDLERICREFLAMSRASVKNPDVSVHFREWGGARSSSKYKLTSNPYTRTPTSVTLHWTCNYPECIAMELQVYKAEYKESLDSLKEIVIGTVPAKEVLGVDIKAMRQV